MLRRRERERESGSVRHLTEKDPGELRALITGFLGSVPGAFIVLDKQWNLVYMNRDAQEFFVGEDESLIGRPLKDVYPRQFSHLLAPQTIRGLLEGKENSITRYVNHFSKWFKVSAYSSDYGIFIRLEDVTVDMASNRSLRLYQASIENGRYMVFWLKPSGHIIYANKALSKSLGFQKQELARMMVADIEPSFADNKLATFVEDLKMSGSIVYESSLRASNRSIIPVEVTCYYLVYHGEEYLIVSARDITDRKKAEEALRESEERFRAFMNNSPAIAWMKDAQSRYVYINKTYEKEFGVRSEDRLGKTDFDVWPREVAEEFRKSDLAAMVSGRPRHLIEETPNMDGSTNYWFDIKFPFKDASGNMFVGGIGIDITRQKQVEEALKEATLRNELYVDLMGHDINNINQVAMGYLEIGLKSLSLDNDEKEFLLKPLEALKNSVSLIENVQKLKKLKSGGLSAEVKDLNDILQELKDQYSGIVDKDIKIDYKPKPGCNVMANGLLKDVFSNILGNAIKHTPGDHVSINIRLSRSNSDGKKYYRVAVEDSGPGIPDEMKTRIFNRLERGSTKARGKGLGLYLVKTLVDDFHGKVWVEDRVKGDHTQGSRFIVMLPAVDGETDVKKSDSPHIGIVEDDSNILGLYKKVLSKHGMSIDHTAINGTEAVEMVKNARPGLDIIIMDHRMPGMTGLEAAREILKIAPQVKIIFASADAGIKEEAMKAGAYKFLHKPVTPKDIINAINDIS
jgi:PAS domain S-box-containing protein